MDDLSKATDTPVKKTYARWSKSITSNNVTKTVEVEECENGFLCRVSKYGDVNGKYISEDKKYICETNPLEDCDKKDSKDDMLDSMKDMMQTFSGKLNM